MSKHSKALGNTLRRYLLDDSTGPMAFDDWSEAYALCRERDQPLVVTVCDGPATRIFPSGHYVRIGKASR